MLFYPLIIRQIREAPLEVDQEKSPKASVLQQSVDRWVRNGQIHPSTLDHNLEGRQLEAHSPKMLELHVAKALFKVYKRYGILRNACRLAFDI
jgi:hypothetical protein